MTDHITISSSSTLLSPLHFSEWKADNFRAVNKFYKRQKHKGSASGNERVFVVMTDTNLNTEAQIIAAVRLVPADDYYWLRSLYVDQVLQGQSIGSQLLAFIQQHVSLTIHCFPYKHLEHFYQQADYSVTPLLNAPLALQQLYERYSAKADNILIMSRIAQRS